ncbi:hypothetical protein Aph01nite_54320 [Acrocarpospora phusangensis]|uniref:Chaplin domain-containing protein n=1 Tax=Acrocarpospora phusangensis TaxID=1070424 RepID=A0A919UQQ1_9ACTN|nr:chaplin family protein [Acrocarpospora phusangensis]GIH27122.1 hypothetical protein Aph01nite_54320 [Acrocarpospora phusangensis]
MRTWAKGSAPAALLAAGVMALGSGTAIADTSGTSSVGGGNQVNLPVSLPIDISGNAVGVAGDSTAGSKGGASVENTTKGIPGKTSGNSSVLGGNQVNAPISAPVNACGNAVSLFGSSQAGCVGGSSVKNSGHGGAGGNTTNGDHSVLGGNQITAPISAPVNACGNAIAIFGEAVAGCKGGSSVRNTGVGAGGNRTSGRSSVLGGNQVIAPISGPINICGNTVAIFGEAFSGCKGGSSVTNTGKPGKPGHRYHQAKGSTGNDTDGRFGAGSGNQVIAPVSLPINLCGNSVGGGVSGCKGGTEVQNTLPGTAAGGNRTDGKSGLLSGNQVVAPITAPINICGNAVAVAGEAFAGCLGGASVKNGGKGAGGNTTSGRSGALAGNQVVAPITAPINACGNAVAALGASEAHCKGGVYADGGPGGGGNTTDGKHGVAAGNQVVAPITAPINACGNSAAVLGDAAAGCLGGSRVGAVSEAQSAADAGYSYWTRSWGKVNASQASGMLPGLPSVPSLAGVKDVGNFTQKMSAAGLPALPLVGDLPGMLGLPALPGLPGLPGAPAAPARTATTAASPIAPVTGLAGSLPVAGSLGQAASALPVGGLGLMSAEQPAGLTGMNGGSLVALLLGAMFAASATLFASTRRFRPGRR